MEEKIFGIKLLMVSLNRMSNSAKSPMGRASNDSFFKTEVLLFPPSLMKFRLLIDKMNIFLEKLSLITNEECIESNVLPIEATKFLEEETPIESVNNDPTTNQQDGEDEDLVC